MKRPADEQLRRIFSLPPIICENQGIRLEELRAASGFETLKELRAGLDRLMMFGVPPFTPSDFITIYVDDDDRVWLDFPLGLERPLALTALEWAAVQQRAAREPAHERLRELLSRISTAPVEIEPGEINRGKRALIQEALTDQLQIEFRYRTLASREAELRTVDPWTLFQRGGVSYVIGFDHLRAAPRFFHLDRMDELDILNAPVSRPAPANLLEIVRNSPIFQTSRSGYTATIAFHPELRAALAGALDIDSITPWDPSDPARQGWLQAECRVRESLWFRQFFRGLGPLAVILAPSFLRAQFRADLDETPIPRVLAP